MRTSANIKVFFVDDDEAFREPLKKYLERECFPLVSIKTFETGEDCLKAMDEMPDMVILDFFLNNRIKEAMNGLGILKLLSSKYPNIPVIMLSSQDDVSIAVQMINSGAFDYVTKSASAFVRIKNLIENIANNKNSNIELKRKVSIYKTINLIVIILLILLFIITRYT